MTQIDACVKLITQNDAQIVPQSMLLLQGVIETFPTEDMLAMDPSQAVPKSKSTIFGGLLGSRNETRKTVLAGLEGKAKLLKTIVNGLEQFSSVEMRRVSAHPGAINGTGGSTRVFSASDQVQIRLDFVSFALRSCPSIKLPDKLVETLWQLCIVSPINNKALDVAWRWFGQAHSANPYALAVSATPLSTIFFLNSDDEHHDKGDSSSQTRSALSDDAELWVLQKGFPLVSPARLTALGVYVLVDYFLSANRKAKTLMVDTLPEQDGVPGGGGAFSPTVDDDTRQKRAIKSAERIAPDLSGLEQVWRCCISEGREDESPSAAEVESFEVLSSLLCRVSLIISLKDPKKAIDIRAQFLQRCTQGIAKATSPRTKRKYVRLLKKFLFKASESPTETCKIIVIPPLAGVPGSLSRRDEVPRSRTGYVPVTVSLASTVGELRRQIIPKAIDYVGTEPLALRVVQKLNLASLAAASVKGTFLKPNQNGKTLRDLGFDRVVIIQCYDRLSDRMHLEDDDFPNGADEDNTWPAADSSVRMLIQQEDADGDLDDAGDEIAQFSDATYSRLFLGSYESLEEEVLRVCLNKFDCNPTSWPPSATFSATPLAVSSAMASNDQVLRAHVSMGESLLGLLQDTASLSRRDLIDLWDCYLALPVDPPSWSPYLPLARIPSALWLCCEQCYWWKTCRQSSRDQRSPTKYSNLLTAALIFRKLSAHVASSLLHASNVFHWQTMPLRPSFAEGPSTGH